jgi:thiaminase/transcriptional activator TenA
VSFSAELREPAAPVWEQHVAHPFVAGIGNGTLPEDKFRFYVRQEYELACWESAWQS